MCMPDDAGTGHEVLTKLIQEEIRRRHEIGDELPRGADRVLRATAIRCALPDEDLNCVAAWAWGPECPPVVNAIRAGAEALVQMRRLTTLC